MVSPDIEAFPLRFSGRGGEFFRVWIVNVLLSIVTLGFYTPFARRRTAQDFFSHTDVAGSPLEFTAQQRKMVIGFLVLVALYIAFNIASETRQDLAVALFMLGGAALAPYLWASAMRFRLGATRWRGLRLQFVPSWGEVYKASWPVFVIALLWAGLALAAEILVKPAGAAQRGGPLRFPHVPLAFWLLLGAALVATLLCTIRLEFNDKSLLVLRARIGGESGRWKPVYGDFVRIWLATLGVLCLSLLAVAALVTALLFALGLGVRDARGFDPGALGIALLLALPVVLLVLLFEKTARHGSRLRPPTSSGPKRGARTAPPRAWRSTCAMRARWRSTTRSPGTLNSGAQAAKGGWPRACRRAGTPAFSCWPSPSSAWPRSTAGARTGGPRRSCPRCRCRRSFRWASARWRSWTAAGSRPAGCPLSGRWNSGGGSRSSRVPSIRRCSAITAMRPAHAGLPLGGGTECLRASRRHHRHDRCARRGGAAAKARRRSVAGVLPHEIGHVLHRHTTRIVVEQAVLNVGLGLALGEVSSLVSLAGSAITGLAYRRAHETEADCFSLALMRKANIATAPMADLLLALQARQGGAAPRQSQARDLLSSHPAPHERALALRAGGGEGCR